MMTQTDLHAAFLADVCANPADDTPRLVYADWLEEHDQPRRCGRCRGSGGTGYGQFGVCPTCNGSGQTPGPDAVRGEFIRVQVELASPAFASAVCTCKRRNDGGLVHECKLCALRRRERELLAAHSLSWLPGSLMALESEYARAVFEWRRGFPARITLRGQDWWGSPGQPGHGPALVRAAPLERVEVSDREPSQATLDRWWGWSFTERDHERFRWSLPRCIWELLPVDPETNVKDYPGPQAARNALSTAMLLWARLPPCEECEGRGRAMTQLNEESTLTLFCRPCHGLGRALPGGQA